tara:strand:+ start:37 stop:498 length:462 start_codon:yes stop_codon:yes gene_type:complete
MELTNLSVEELESIVLPKGGKSSSGEKKHQKVDEVVELLKRFVKNPSTGDAVKRTIQVLCWDVTNTKEYFTGRQTENSIKSGKWVKEHEYGASRFALGLMYEARNGEADIDRDLIYGAFRKYMVWNKTTKEENKILQNNGQDYSQISPLKKVG